MNTAALFYFTLNANIFEWILCIFFGHPPWNIRLFMNICFTLWEITGFSVCGPPKIQISSYAFQEKKLWKSMIISPKVMTSLFFKGYLLVIADIRAAPVLYVVGQLYPWSWCSSLKYINSYWRFLQIQHTIGEIKA